VAGCLGIAAVVGPSVSARADGDGSVPPNPNSYSLSAEADALNVTVVDPSAPIVQTISASPYGASAALDSIGDSLSDAGAPFSPLATSLPGLVSGIGAGTLPPVPPLPGYVSATAPGTPSDSESEGPYAISATASSDDAAGSADLGVAQAGSDHFTFFAQAETSANADGSVTVSGSAGADLVDLGGLLDLGDVSSTASLNEQGSGAPTVTASTNLGTITLLSKPIGLVGQDLSLLGVDVPLHLSTTILPLVNSLLASAGITLTYLPETFIYTDGSKSTGTPNPSKTIQTVDSGALEVELTKNVPSQGIVTVSTTLAGIYLGATDEPAVGGMSALGGSTGLPLLGASTGGLLGGGLLGTGPATVGGALGTTPAGTGGSPTGSGTALSPPLSSTGAITRFVAPGPIGDGLYLVIVIGALAALAWSQLIRLIGVRRRLSRKSS
jgi:hypothetical protein